MSEHRIGRAGTSTGAGVWMLAGLLACVALRVGAATWVPTAGGTYNWDEDANWSPTPFPNAMDAVGDVAVNITNAVAQVINLNQEIILGTLQFGDTSGQTAGQTIQSGTAGSLVMSASSGQALIKRKNANTSKPTTISANIRLDSTTVVDNGTISGAFELILGGAISGTGGLIKTNASASPGVFLGLYSNAKANTYLGLTTVAGGALYTDKNGVIAIPGDALVKNGARLQLNRNNNVADTSVVTLEGTGTFRLSTTSNGPTSDTIGGLASDSVASIAESYALNGTSTLSVVDGATRTFAGSLRDGRPVGKLAIIKKGAGFWTISGTNTTYSGPTTVDGAGGLVVNSTLASSAVALTGGGSLGGSGVVSQAVTCVNGRLAPGAHGAAGTLTLAGGLSVTTALAYDWQLGALSEATDYDRIAVAGGTAALGSSGVVTLDFSPLPAADRPDAADVVSFWRHDRSWTLLAAEGGAITGAFSGLSNGTGWAGGKGSFSLTGGNGNDVVLHWQAPPPNATVILIR